MPDVYVPLRSGNEYVYYNKLINNGLVYRFAFQYTDRQRSDLEQKYAVVGDYIKEFFIDEQLFADFIRFAEEDGIERDTLGIRTSEEKIKILLKAFIGRNIHNDKAFYPIYNESDSIFVKAYQLLSLCGPHFRETVAQVGLGYPAAARDEVIEQTAQRRAKPDLYLPGEQ